MKTNTVKDLMVPLSEYATVSENATLYETIIALEKAQAAFGRNRYRHRAVLILDRDRHVVGKVSQIDVLRALEPKYQDVLTGNGLAHSGLTRQFIKSMLANYNLWNRPLDHICATAAQKKVKEFMYTPSEGEYVDETASLDEALHQLVIGRHQSLLVTRKETIVGILRLTDVFTQIVCVMKANLQTGSSSETC